MELLDRYLRDVRAHLPRGQRDDIITELSGNLRAELEDRESRLGRCLTQQEQQALLAEHGHPMVVARRYRGDERSVSFGRQWIGPELFPLYLRILKINLTVTLGACLVAVLVLARLSADGPPAFPVFSTALLNLILQFSIVTGIFVAADRRLRRNPGGWEPRAQGLFSPKQAVPGESGLDALARHILGKPHDVVPRLVSMGELALGTIWLLWWLAVPGYLGRVFNSSEVAFMRPGLAWDVLYVPFLALLALALIQPCVNLVQPRWGRFRAIARLTVNGAFMALLALAMTVGRWFVLVDTGSTTAAQRDFVARANHWTGVCVLLVIWGIGILFLLQVWALARRPGAAGGARSLTQA